MTPATARYRIVVLAVLLFVSLGSPAAAQVLASDPPTTSLDRVGRTFILTDLLEYAPNGANKPIRFDLLGWVGGDYNRLWLRADGEQTTAPSSGEAQVDVLYGRLVSPFWTAVGGIRVDSRSRTAGGADGNAVSTPGATPGAAPHAGRSTRGLLAAGLQGLSPYWFEMEPTLFVSQHGDISAQFKTSFDLLFTQRLILQPRLEMNAAVQKVPEFGVASGLNDVEIGARMRYEFRREFAPYVGLSWIRRTGGTAVLVRRSGEPVSDGRVVFGLRMWN